MLIWDTVCRGSYSDHYGSIYFSFPFLPIREKGFLENTSGACGTMYFPIFIIFSILSPIKTKSERPEDVLPTILSKYRPYRFPMNISTNSHSSIGGCTLAASSLHL